MKKFLDDPNRNVEPHEYSDFHKELIQVLNEVKQESELILTFTNYKTPQAPPKLYGCLGGFILCGRDPPSPLGVLAVGYALSLVDQ